jgi:uncharacterized damage-inducible protein DinB
MTLVEILLPEFDREMGLTRGVLDRVPDQHFAWRPHPTSVTLGRLAEHLSELPRWAATTLTQETLDMSVGRAEGYQPPASRAAALTLFDANVKAARDALVGKTDGELMAPWKLLSEGKELFTMPKATVLRNFVFNHMVHHRAQMMVYLRMLGVPVPSMYGPSGDERRIRS